MVSVLARPQIYTNIEGNNPKFYKYFVYTNVD